MSDLTPTHTISLTLLFCVLFIFPPQVHASTIYVNIYVSDCYTMDPLDSVLLYISYFDCAEVREKNLDQRQTDRLGRIAVQLPMCSFVSPIQIIAKRAEYLRRSERFRVEVGTPIRICLEQEEPIKVIGKVKNQIDDSLLDRVRIRYGLKSRKTAISISETYTDTLGNFKSVFDIDYLKKTIKYHLSKPGFKPHKGEITLDRENELPIYLIPNNSGHRKGGLWNDLKLFIPAFAVTFGSFVYFTYYYKD